MEKYGATLLDSKGVPYKSSILGKFGGHRKLKIYGKLDCKNALRWLSRGYYEKYRVFFKNEKDAIAAGYRPCFYCMRSEYNKYFRGKNK